MVFILLLIVIYSYFPVTAAEPEVRYKAIERLHKETIQQLSVDIALIGSQISPIIQLWKEQHKSLVETMTSIDQFVPASPDEIQIWKQLRKTYPLMQRLVKNVINDLIDNTIDLANQTGVIYSYCRRKAISNQITSNKVTFIPQTSSDNAVKALGKFSPHANSDFVILATHIHYLQDRDTDCTYASQKIYSMDLKEIKKKSSKRYGLIRAFPVDSQYKGEWIRAKRYDINWAQNKYSDKPIDYFSDGRLVIGYFWGGIEIQHNNTSSYFVINKNINQMCCSDDNIHIAIVSTEKEEVLLDENNVCIPENNNTISIFDMNNTMHQIVQTNPQCRSFSTCFADKDIGVATTPTLIFSYTHKNPVQSMHFYDAQTIIFTDSRKIYTLDASSHVVTEIASVKPSCSITSMAFCTSKNLLAYSDSKGKIRLKNLKESKKYKRHIDICTSDKINTIAVSKNGTFLAAGAGNRAYIWDISGQNPQLVAKIKCDSTVEVLEFSPDEKYCAAQTIHTEKQTGHSVTFHMCCTPSSIIEERADIDGLVSVFRQNLLKADVPEDKYSILYDNQELLRFSNNSDITTLYEKTTKDIVQSLNDKVHTMSIDDLDTILCSFKGISFDGTIIVSLARCGPSKEINRMHKYEKAIKNCLVDCVVKLLSNVSQSTRTTFLKKHEHLQYFPQMYQFYQNGKKNILSKIIMYKKSLVCTLLLGILGIGYIKYYYR